MIVLYFVFVIACSSDLFHRCVHDELEHIDLSSHDGANNLHLRGGRRAGGTMEPIRIRLRYNTLSDALNPELVPHIKKLAGEAVPTLEGILSLVRLTGNLTVTRPTPDCNDWNGDNCDDPNLPSCYVLTIPSSDLNPPMKDSNGVLQGTTFPNTDLLVYLVSKKVSQCDDGAKIFSQSCYTLGDGRPSVGYINFCPTVSGVPVTNSSFEDSESSHLLKGIFLHEFMHVLGFSSGFYDDYKDPDGDSWNDTTKDITEKGHTVRKFITPTAIEKNEELFGCLNKTIGGVELENGGGSGIKWSHTECRLYPQDFMNAVIYSNYKLSPISFSILDDSGWYDVDYSKLEELTYFRGDGCEAAVEGSGQWDYPCKPIVKKVEDDDDSVVKKTIVVTVMLLVVSFLL